MKKILVFLFGLVLFAGIEGLGCLGRAEQFNLFEVVEQTKIENLFDNQIQRLKKLGMDKVIVKMLEKQRSSVIAMALKMDLKHGHIPFLPVIPKTYLSIFTQVQMVSMVSYEKEATKDAARRNLLFPSLLTDVVETPKDPYYIFDVEDGQETLGQIPQRVGEKLSEQKVRRGLTETEIISVAVHTDVLSRHYLFGIGSRYNFRQHNYLIYGVDVVFDDWDNIEHVPDLWVNIRVGPELHFNRFDSPTEEWGTPSCLK